MTIADPSQTRRAECTTQPRQLPSYAFHSGCIDRHRWLAGANPDGRAGFRLAIPCLVKIGDVAPAVDWWWQQPQEGEVLDAADASPDRFGALHQGVLGRRARDAELKRNLATRVGDDQLGHRVGTEDGLGGREVELGQVEVGALGVHAHKVVVAVGSDPATRFGHNVSVERGNAPGGELLGGKCAPAPGDSAEVAPVSQLLGRAGIARAHVRAHDVPVTSLEINDGALSARLWNGADLHIVSGTRFLRCRFTRPQLGGYLNRSKTRTGDASSINFSPLERWASSLSHNHPMQPQMDTDKHRYGLLN